MKRLICTLLVAALGATAHAQEMEPCEPGEPAPREGLACLPHIIDGVGEWILDPGQLLNARKGDVPLSPGCGFIGRLLTQVDPTQIYAHTGIMTLDRYAIRHSTGSDARIQDYPIGELAYLGEPTDGFRSDVMRYGWPGTISQSIKNAYEGEFLTDPDHGHSYRIDAFNDRVDQNCELKTPPAVMKPPLDEELANDWVRPMLHSAAAAAETIHGHYRLYHYTDGSQFEVAPAEAGWAEGTVPTVCSTFVREAVRAAGAHLEGALEPEDCTIPEGATEARAQVSLDAPCAPGQAIASPAHDGLYLYNAAERAKAAAWLHAELHQKALEQAGGGGQAFYDVPDDVADLFTNCFGFDWCGGADEGVRDVDGSSDVFACTQEEFDAKDSNCWEQPGIGRTASPDDMLLWDAPSHGGVYGHKETLSYRESRYFLRHRWQPAAGFGAVEGRVMSNGLAQYGVEVIVSDIPDFTDLSGEFSIMGVPPGDHEIKACKEMKNGQFLSATGAVTVQAGQTASVELQLEVTADCMSDPPVTRWTREVSVGGHFTITDDEFWTSNEVGTIQVPAESVILHPLPGLDRHSFTFQGCVGDEVTAIIELVAELNVTTDQPVLDTQMKVTLKEGASCADQEVEKKATFGHDVAPGTTVFYNEHVVSDEWDSNDTIDVQIYIANTHPIWDETPNL